MRTLDDILKEVQPARLFPVVADTRKEERIVSILLATLAAIRPLSKDILERCGTRVGKYTQITSYTEVEFLSADGKSHDRPDGILCLRSGKSQWAAIIEAKVDNSEIDSTQIEKYAEIAQRHRIDAIITLSNQFVPLPTHVPYPISKKYTRNLNLFHFSWSSILTQASLILRGGEELDDNQSFMLHEMLRYFEHPSSGVRRFDQMNPEWKELVLGIQNGQQFKWSSPEIENTVASWHQEERDISLKLSQRIGQQVAIGGLSRKHKADPVLRLREASEALVARKELRSSFKVPNAASDLEFVADLQRRTLSCSMRLNAPLDKKRTSARINWLVRQLRGVSGDNIQVRAFWPGRAMQTQASLGDVKVDAVCLNNKSVGKPPTGFEIAMIRDIAGRFSRRRAFIEDIEKLVPEFYDQVGQHLRPWVPPPPTIDSNELGEKVDAGQGDGQGRSGEITPLEKIDSQDALDEGRGEE